LEIDHDIVLILEFRPGQLRGCSGTLVTLGILSASSRIVRVELWLSLLEFILTGYLRLISSCERTLIVPAGSSFNFLPTSGNLLLWVILLVFLLLLTHNRG
jgi:hypothetical protein